MKNGVMIWLVDNKERSKSKPAGRERKASDQWQQSKEYISVFAKVSIAAGSCEGFSEGKRQLSSIHLFIGGGVLKKLSL